MRVSSRAIRLTFALWVSITVNAAAVHAQTLFAKETFSGVPFLQTDFTGDISGTSMKVTAGSVQVITDPGQTGRTNIVWMGLGAYQSSRTGVTNAALQAKSTFDLFAGVSYTLQFDWSRQDFSGGNGPFPFSLTAQLGSMSLVSTDAAGFFFYPLNWQTTQLIFTPVTTELGAIFSFAGAGGGYSGLYLDNISMVGVGSPTSPPTSPPGAVVPEPSTYALMLSGLAALGMIARKRRRA